MPVVDYIILIFDTNILLSSLRMTALLAESHLEPSLDSSCAIMKLDRLAMNETPLGEATKASILHLPQVTYTHMLTGSKHKTSWGRYGNLCRLASQVIGTSDALNGCIKVVKGLTFNNLGTDLRAYSKPRKTTFNGNKSGESEFCIGVTSYHCSPIGLFH
jgi:hypothetical protein